MREILYRQQSRTLESTKAANPASRNDNHMLSVGCDVEGVAAKQLLGVHCMVLLQWDDHQSRLMVLLQLASLLQKHCRHVIT